MYQRGDILQARDRRRIAGRHFIVFYQTMGRGYFLGAMLTHLERPGLNVAMQDSHFLDEAPDGNAYKVTYDDTYLVRAKLMKLESWGPFRKVGKLSAEGVRFVEEIIDQLQAEEWTHYLIRNQE